MIPTKVVIIGDLARGQMFKGFAENQLRILRRSMKFQDLNEGSKTVKPYPDVVVECWSSFSLSEINIHVLGKKGEGEELEEEKKKQKCFCTCHLTIGFIQYHRHACYDFTDLNIVYDVLICKKKRYYALLKNVPPMGFTPFKHNQKVLVVFEPDIDGDP